MNQKARKVINVLVIAALLAQTIFMPNYVYAQQVIATPPGALLVVANGERFMNAAPLAIDGALQLAQRLEAINQTDLKEVPASELVEARRFALQTAQQTAVAQGALGGILYGLEQLEVSARDAVDLDQLFSEVQTNGLPVELETALLEAGLTITAVAALESGTTGSFDTRRDVGENGFVTETATFLQGLGLSAGAIIEVEQAYATYGVADDTTPDKLAQLRGTQDELTLARNSALVTYIQLLSQQVYQAQLNEETGRPMATADVDALAADQLRLLVHMAYLQQLWGGAAQPDVGEGQWLFVERYSWRVAERLDVLILETHNLGLTVDLLLALQIHATALAAQSGGPVQAMAELEKLAEIQATLVGDNLPGGQAALQSSPSLLWRMAVTVYDKTDNPALLNWVNREEVTVTETAVTVSKDELYGRVARLAKPPLLPTFSGNVDESDETNNTDIALFYTKPSLPPDILSFIEEFIPGFSGILDFVWGVLTGQSDNPLAIGINIVLSFSPVLGIVLDAIALVTAQSEWERAFAFIGMLVSILSDGAELLMAVSAAVPPALAATVPGAILMEALDVGAAVMKGIRAFVGTQIWNTIKLLRFDKALKLGGEALFRLARFAYNNVSEWPHTISGVFDLLTTTASEVAGAFGRILTRFSGNLDEFSDGAFLAGRVLNRSEDASSISNATVTAIIRFGDELGDDLSHQAVDGLDKLVHRLPSNKLEEALSGFCSLRAGYGSTIILAKEEGTTSWGFTKDRFSKPLTQAVNCREIAEGIFGSLAAWSDDSLNGLQRLVNNGNWTGDDILEILNEYRLGNLGPAFQHGFESALATLNKANIGNWAPDRRALESMSNFIGRTDGQVENFASYTESFLNRLFETGVDEHFNEQFRRMMVRLNGESNNTLRGMVAPDIIDDIRKGVIETLRKAEHPNTPWPAKHGYDFQLRRGEHYFQAKELRAFEFDEVVEGTADTEFAYDLLILRNGVAAIAEVKYWRASTFDSNRAALIRQITNYKNTGRHIIVEFGATVDTPIQRETLEAFRTHLINRSGFNDTDFTLRLITRDGEVIPITGN